MASLRTKSRGYEDTAEKIERFEKEKTKFREKWQNVLDEGDPFYNKNFPNYRSTIYAGVRGKFYRIFESESGGGKENEHL